MSIIICTRNRAEHLSQTLAAMAETCVPEATPAELIVVDNDSRDDTALMVKAFDLPNMPVRYIPEPRQGLCHARNTGIAAAQGQIILFTDDDVRPPRNWIAGMCQPIIDDCADAVAGGVKLAPFLAQDWMNDSCLSMLASTERVSPCNPSAMIGANMAFSRKIVDKVPKFDPDLGAGALGFFDEELFSWQLKEAGFRLISAFNVVVEHHPDPERISRTQFLETQRKYGRSLAYIDHHWKHRQIKAVRARMFLRQAKLFWQRTLASHEVRQAPCPAYWELNHISVIAFYKQYLVERKRLRNYERKGLQRIR